MGDIIAQLREFLAKATPGPWETDSEYDGNGLASGDGGCTSGWHNYFVGADVDGKWRTLLDTVNSDHKLIEDDRDEDGGRSWDVIGEANANLVAAAITALPALLDRVEAGEVAIAALEDRAGYVESRYRHTRQWNAERWERITAYAKEHGFWDDIACIMANGTLSGTERYDPPTYAQQLNIAIHRAEAAEDRASKMQGRLEEAEGIIQRLHDHDGWGDKGFHSGHALDAKNDGIRFLQQKDAAP